MNKWNVKTDGRQMSPRQIIDTIFVNRGILKVNRFLNPTVNDLIPFEQMKNIDIVAKTIIEGIQQHKTFTIHFDVDVDGCSSGAIMYRYLSHFTDKLHWQINKGKIHGIGGVKFRLPTDILIVVDSINEYEDYKKLHNQVNDIVVLDHHIIPDSVLKSDLKLVSSANDYPNNQLSGAGVVWKVCKYLDTLMSTNYADELADLATYGIIADMCSVDKLHMENRYICSLGLSNLKNIGIKQILKNYQFNAESVSYSIAPLVNSACRMGNNELSAKLFISDDKKVVQDCIKKLQELKAQQKEEVDKWSVKLTSQAENQKEHKYLFLCIESNSGIAGLIANQMVRQYHKPCFVLQNYGDIYRGSCRGLGENFKEVVNETQLAETGGHENAFGVSILKKDIEQFKRQLDKLLQTYEFSEQVDIDIQLNANQITHQLIKKLQSINFISGQDFKPISVLISGIDDYTLSSLGNGKHLKIQTDDIDFIKWNFKGNTSEFDNTSCYKTLSFVGTLSESYFRGKYNKQLIIDDYSIEEGLDI